MSDKVFRFSASNNADTLVDMNAVEEVVSLSAEAAKLGKQLEAELAAQDADSAQDGLKKFIRSQIEASMSDGQTRHVQVMDEDALADLVIAKGLEHVEVKCEYHLGKDNWQFCKDLGVLYINSDGDFDAIKEQALAHGIRKVESTLSKAVQCDELTELMRVESKITGNPAAVFFPHAYDKAQAIKLVQLNGVISAKAWAKVGGAVAIGSNFVDVLTGDKTVKQAAKDMATSAAKEFLIDYAKNQVIATAVRQPLVKEAIARAGGKTLMKTIGSTKVGAAGLNAISAADAFAGAFAKNAVLSSSGLAITAINGVGGTAAGLASSVGLTGTAGAITAGTAGLTGAVGAAAAFAAPLAPLAIGGAAVYGVGKLLKKIF